MMRKVCSFLAFMLLLFFFVSHVFKLTDYMYNLILNFFSSSMILEIIIMLFFFFMGMFIVNPSLLLQKVMTFYNFMNLFKMEMVSSIWSTFSMEELKFIMILMYVMLLSLAISLNEDTYFSYMIFMIMQVCWLMFYFFFYLGFFPMSDVLNSLLFLFVEIIFFEFSKKLNNKEYLTLFNMFLFSIFFFILITLFYVGWI